MVGPEDERPGLVRYRKRTNPDLWLPNQYLVVAHMADDPIFVDSGDSGSVCYLNSSAWNASERWKLRPWGLLHSRIHAGNYSFAVLSPLDAVLRCFAGREFRLLGVDAAHLLGGGEGEAGSVASGHCTHA